MILQPEKPCGRHVLTMEQVSVTRDEKVILSGITASFRCGQISAVIGRNGAGKSTLIKAVLGAIPFHGSIRFEGEAGRGADRPKIGYVPQQLNLERNTPMSVYDFIASFASRYPVFLPKRKSLYQRIGKHLELFQADGLMEAQVSKLSGGQLQRVMLAAATVNNPEWLILDEPVSGIDQAGLESFYEVLDSLKTQFDMAIILVSHDLEYVRRSADQVLLLDQTVLACGTAEEVYASQAFAQVFHRQEQEGREC